MRVALLAMGPPDDLSTWSGIPFHVSEALRGASVHVDSVDVSGAPYARYRYWRSRMEQVLGGRGSRSDLYCSAVEAYARNAEGRIAELDPDIVLSMSAMPLASLETDRPVALWTDATFECLVDFYPPFVRMPRRQRRLGREVDRRALQRCDAVFLASSWAASSAQRDCGVPADRITVVPFGANLVSPPPSAEVERTIAARDGSVCSVLFVGLDWERKRGDFAINVVEAMRRQGINAHLTVIGGSPLGGATLPGYVRCLGRIDTNTRRGQDVIDAEFASADFLLLPSQAECFGIVIAEASAYGVPSVGSRTGGIPEAIRPAENGILMDPAATADEYASEMHRLFTDHAEYKRVATSARRDFETRLNWASSVDVILTRMRELVATHATHRVGPASAARS